MAAELARVVPTPRSRSPSPAGNSLLPPPRPAPSPTPPSAPSVRCSGPTLKVGARLSHFLPQWRKLCSDTHVVSVIDRGVRLDFKDEPPPITRSSLAVGADHPDLLNEVKEMLEKGAVVPVPSDSLGFRSRLFLVRKRNGDWRPVINLRPLNLFLRKEKFKMETQRSIRASLKKGEWAVSIDLKDAYFHIPIAKEAQKYLLFQVGGQTYKFVALPFGLSSAPREFTRVVTVVAHLAHGLSIRLHIYLDDWLIRAESPSGCRAHRDLILDLVRSLGFVINLDKSMLDPTQHFTFLGESFDLERGLVRPSQTNMDKIQEEVNYFANASRVRARQFLRLLGLLNSVADVIVLGRLHMRPLQYVLLSQWKPKFNLLEDWVYLTPDFQTHLNWWRDPQTLMKGVPLEAPRTTLTMCTDSSLEGWGATLDSSLTVHGRWSRDEAQESINFLEAKTILLAVKHWATRLSGATVLILCDNTTAVSYFKKQGGTFSPAISWIVWQTLLFCQPRDITLVFRHIKGKLNVQADQLSRLSRPVPTEWSLNKSVFRALCRHFGDPALDLFATRLNKQLPVFVSPTPDDLAIQVDALAMDWSRLPRAYAFPPSPLLPLILRKIKESVAEVLLIAPYWPKQPWFPDLLGLLMDHPVELPLLEDLLTQKMGGKYWKHQQPGLFRYHGWMLSGRRSTRRAFLSRQQPVSPHLRGQALLVFTTGVGQNSAIGVVESRLIQSSPLYLR